MLDVLITRSLDTPVAFAKQCIESVMLAAERAPFETRIILVPGVPGNIGQAMTDGLKMAAMPYVAWVDDDDYVLPHAFAVLENSMARGAPAICAREFELYANGHMHQGRNRHHLTVYGREWVLQHDLTGFKATPNVALLERLPADTIDLMEWVYVRRVRLSGGMVLRGKYMAQESKLWH